MTVKRLSVKFFVQEPGEIDLAPFMEVFQRWIQQQRIEGLLIDVADYHHVHHGPGVVLVGDEGDYSFDTGEGRPGLLYTRKRQIPETLQDALSECARLAIIACQNLEKERALKPHTFTYSEIKLMFLDRLNLSNTAEAFAQIRPEIEAFATALFGGAAVEISQVVGDPREALTVCLQAAEMIKAEVLLERLGDPQSLG